MRKKINKNNKTKNLIFTTTLDLLRKNGSLILKDISETANVNIAAINYYYGDKDNLIKEVITSELKNLKAGINELATNCINNPGNPKDDLTKILAYMYDFAIGNLGLLKYIFSANNKQIAEETIYLYIHEISLDTDFMDNVMKLFNVLIPNYSIKSYNVKYTQLISTFAFPIVMELDILKIDFTYFNSILDDDFRKKYIQQLCETFFIECKD